MPQRRGVHGTAAGWGRTPRGKEAVAFLCKMSARWPEIRAALIIYTEIVLMCRDFLEQHMGLTSVADSN